VKDGRWLEGDQDPAASELRRALDEARLATADDVTLRRMWGRVADPGPGRRRGPRWLWFAAGMAATAAIAFLLGGWLSARPKLAVRPVVAPPVAIAPAPAPAFDPGAAGTVRTGAGETLRLTLRGGTEARLGSSSVMSLDEEERPTVEGGEVGFKVPHQQPGHAFVVRAGAFRVVVVGTKFGLRVDDGGRVRVAVEEGTVEVWNRTRLARLAAGEQWESPHLAAQESAAAPAPAPARAPSSLHARSAPHARTLALAAAEGPSAKAASNAPGAAGAPTADGAPAPAAGGDAAADARAALAAGDATRALALYRAVAQKGGPAGENAEYEIGKILRDRLGQPASAIAAWRRYRADHPNGILRVEADVSIIEALVHAGEPDAALAEASDFLRRYPNSERRAEIARIAGDLFRSSGDCARAVTAYEVALASPHAAGVAEAASFHRAACLVRLGDPSGADAARAYLRSWPAGRFRDEAAGLAALGRNGAEGRARP